jgi:hypothetical protein
MISSVNIRSGKPFKLRTHKKHKEDVVDWSGSCCNLTPTRRILYSLNMKTNKLLAAIFVLLAITTGASTANAQWGGWGGFGPGFAYQGWGNYYPYAYYFSPNPYSPYLGKVKIEGDVDYNKKIDSQDAALGNHPKKNPYGLVIGAGELTKLILTTQPNPDRQVQVGKPKVKLPFPILVASLEVRGINLGHKRGRFASFEDEVAASGRVLVWLDHTKRHLLLDSSDPARRRVEWPYANSVPPERVFVEGIVPSQPGSAFIVTLTLDDTNRKGLSKIFSEPAIWDRQLITVHVPGVHPKPWFDSSPVWVNTSGAGK